LKRLRKKKQAKQDKIDLAKSKISHAAALKKMSETLGAPSQGYDELSGRKNVEHENGKTMTSDWGEEWPRVDETHEESKKRICREEKAAAEKAFVEPSKWCKDMGLA